MNTELYRKAAESIKLGDCVCLNLKRMGAAWDGPEHELFVYLFKPERVAINDSWFGSEKLHRNQLARQLALLLAAELAEKGAL